MLYLDTSLLVSALSPEARTAEVEGWMDAQDQSQFAISAWVATEFSAALSNKVRTKQINSKFRPHLLELFDALVRDVFEVFPVEVQNFRRAREFCDLPPLGLRAGDALHLAIAFDRGATLCTLDRRLLKAGPEVGVATVSV